ncbi:cellulase family glycosylhydrolase [Flavobacterium subsaxonicum]|uniref:1,4-beta-xylanase n=1 Tax=Flavobacterium subsaxonicum WB 4.1-42 = DSM 21790 TaxID=1121898 RepID=A0A0A2MG41_9FLAO|nr:cellulase family glycosylhydrolase [Flavobacterium subsaxonicum]KGO91219.1 1,4-beta-xylanase [Flavobacterium subsaxonicum WB 4.1-42 = DSM 21790]
MKKILILIACFASLTLAAQGQRWSTEKADKWYAEHKWMTGANFIPSTAINQLEMWQEATFDPQTIDRELGYAQGIGFNTMRVFLHSLAYKADPKGFKKRIDKYLEIANKRGILTMFVFFDDCWSPTSAIGRQPEPKTGIHNSGWLQDPGFPASEQRADDKELQAYVKDILTTFGKDKRILLWDLYNEPGNSNKGDKSLALLKNVFKWAREANPEQPISVGLWKWDFVALNTIQAQNSDVITYHFYEAVADHQRVIELLKTHDRPMICTEYMARTKNNIFSNNMTLLKKENIGAINWGLVAGKTNTIYAWDTPMATGEEPDTWFHDIFRKDGTPYRQDEVNLIKKLNGVK